MKKESHKEKMQRYRLLKKKERAEKQGNPEEVLENKENQRKLHRKKSQKECLQTMRRRSRWSRKKVARPESRKAPAIPWRKCVKCGNKVLIPVRYAQSHIGPVFICRGCKSRAKQENSGKKCGYKGNGKYSGVFVRICSGGGGPGTGKRR